MVPWLAETFEAIGPLQARVRELSGEIDAITRRAKSNGGGGAETELASRRRELQKNSEQVEKRLQEIRDRGLVVRSLDDGLVDFPTQREGRYVYLCWREGEAEIRFLARPGHGLRRASAVVRPRQAPRSGSRLGLP